MKSKNSGTPDPYRLLLNLTDKYVALSNLSIYYISKNIKVSYKSNRFKISAPAWNEEFYIQEFFKDML